MGSLEIIGGQVRNMRQELAKREGQRGIYIGIFAKEGIKHSPKGKYTGQTVLLKDVRDFGGNTVCSHIWLNQTKQLKEAEPVYGDKIQFLGKVESYNRFNQKSFDYGIVGLSNVINLSKIGDWGMTNGNKRIYQKMRVSL